MDILIEQLAARTLKEMITIPTSDGETVQQFMCALRDAGRTAIKATYGEKLYVSTQDTDGSSAVFNVWQYSDDASIDTYLKLDYARDMATGVFTFSNPVEMARVTSYEPAPEGQRELGIVTVAATIEAIAALDSPTALDIANAAIDLGDSKTPDRTLKAKLEEQAARIPASDPNIADMFNILRAV